MRRARGYEVVVRLLYSSAMRRPNALSLATDIRSALAGAPIQSRWFIKTAIREIPAARARNVKGGKRA